MIRDLRTILEGWAFEPGKISVRKIIGCDRHEKIQARVDLGVMQFRLTGRPDGERPHGFDSLLEFYEHRLGCHMETFGDAIEFELQSDECHELRREAYMYHQRFIALFVLEEFDAVVRDTERTLRLIDLCARYAVDEFDRNALKRYSIYVRMMHCRARAMRLMGQQQHDDALAEVNRGLAMLSGVNLDEMVEEDEQPVSVESETELLLQLRDEIYENMPDDAAAKLQLQLGAAIEAEDYERAASLRDRLDRARSTDADCEST